MRCWSRFVSSNEKHLHLLNNILAIVWDRLILWRRKWRSGTNMALYHPSHSLCLVQAQPMKMMVSSKYIGFVVFLWYFFFLIWVLCCERSGDIDSKWRKWRKLCDIAWWKLLWRNSKSQVSLWSSLWLTWLLDPQALNTTNSTKIPSLYKTQR